LPRRATIMPIVADVIWCRFIQYQTLDDQGKECGESSSFASMASKRLTTLSSSSLFVTTLYQALLRLCKCVSASGAFACSAPRSDRHDPQKVASHDSHCPEWALHTPLPQSPHKDVASLEQRKPCASSRLRTSTTSHRSRGEAINFRRPCLGIESSRTRKTLQGETRDVARLTPFRFGQTQGRGKR
jgi:hypothetical protein